MSLPSFYTLATGYRTLLESDDEEIDPITLRDTIEGLEGNLQTKAVNLAAVALSIESAGKAAEEAAKALLERSKRLYRRRDALRSYLKTGMETAGVHRFETPELTISIRRNPASVLIDQNAVIPDRFMRIPEPPPPAPDKKAIAEALKAGETIKGVELVQSTRLEIRT